MFVVMYRWRLKPGLEKQFIESWAEVTKYFLEHCDSLGSRLHEGNDGIWYAYAQWKSAADREKASLRPDQNSAWTRMRESAEESFPEVELKMVSDFLQKIPEI